MAAVRSEVRGALIAVTTSSYDAFTNAEGQHVPGGENYTLWLADAYDRAPTEIKVAGSRRSLIEGLIGQDKFQGVGVTCQCYVNAKNTGGRYPRLELSLDSIEVAAAPKGMRAAS